MNTQCFGEMQTVGVRYMTSTMIYTFMTDQACKVGDKAVVFTSGSYNVVTIVEVHDEPQLKNKHIQYTWLVQVVNLDHYNALIARDGEGQPQAGSRL
jgi:hypothetical protein